MFTTLRQKWFWYSIASALCWTGWAFSAKFGSALMPPNTMQLVAASGLVFIGLILLAAKRFRIERSVKGTVYGLLSGLALALGGIALYGAYRVGTNTAVVTTATSLYPMVTVLLAVLLLREHLNRLQLLGVVFALAAIVIFSL